MDCGTTPISDRFCSCEGCGGGLNEEGVVDGTWLAGVVLGK